MAADDLQVGAAGFLDAVRVAQRRDAPRRDRIGEQRLDERARQLPVLFEFHQGARVKVLVGFGMIFVERHVQWKFLIWRKPDADVFELHEHRTLQEPRHEFRPQPGQF